MAFDFKKYKSFPKVSTSIIVVSFLFPFFLVKCGGTTIASIKGIDLIVGMEIGDGAKAEELGMNIFAIVALVCAVGGAILAWIKNKQSKKISLVVAVLGLISLVVLAVQLKSEAGSSKQEMITIGLGIGYYLAFLGFLLNSLFFGFGMKEDNEPPKRIDDPDTVDVI